VHVFICSALHPHGWTNGWQDLNRKLRLHRKTWWIQVVSWFSYSGLCCRDCYSQYNPTIGFYFHIFLWPYCDEQAVIKGFWIVFEDIDKAPSDVQSILLPLLEGSSSFSVGHAEVKISYLFIYLFILFKIIIIWKVNYFSRFSLYLQTSEIICNNFHKCQLPGGLY
jgi:hypothetical protein